MATPKQSAVGGIEMLLDDHGVKVGGESFWNYRVSLEARGLIESGMTVGQLYAVHRLLEAALGAALGRDPAQPYAEGVRAAVARHAAVPNPLRDWLRCPDCGLEAEREDFYRAEACPRCKGRGEPEVLGQIVHGPAGPERKSVPETAWPPARRLAAEVQS